MDCKLLDINEGNVVELSMLDLIFLLIAGYTVDKLFCVTFDDGLGGFLGGTILL
jgi:hypothetical protein